MGLLAFQLLQQRLSLSLRADDKPFQLININTGSRLQLDASATYALGVFDAGVDGLFITIIHLVIHPSLLGPKTMTLFGLLNQCKTKMGVRRLRQMLREPSGDLTEIETRHDLVEIFFRNNNLRVTIQVCASLIHHPISFLSFFLSLT